MKKTDSIIEVTAAAQGRIADVLKQQEDALGIRIRIAGKTATEYKVQLGIARSSDETQPTDSDTIIECKSFKVYVDAESAKNLKGASLDFVQEGHQSGFKVNNPNKPLVSDPKVFQIQKFIDEAINPSVAQHGGVIELLDVKDDTLFVHMGGGCQGCSQSTLTLRQGVERMVKEKFPEIKKIIDTTDHAAGTNPYYKKG